MGYRIVQTAVGWLLCVGGEQLGVYDKAGEVFATAAFVMQSRGHNPAGTWRRQLDVSYDWDNTRSD